MSPLIHQLGQRIRVTCADVQQAIPDVSDVQFLSGKGGQKLVFTCVLGGTRWALKVLDAEHDTDESTEEKVARARREVETLTALSDPHLVRLGPRQLTATVISGHRCLYFTEELIVGEDLQDILKADGGIGERDVARLGYEIGGGVAALWDRHRVHRDVKPGNIMRRSSDGSFVLLDVGIAIDPAAQPITAPGFFRGTVPYVSPEQTDPGRKAGLDFRSDLFSLGTVMYEALTGVHPFWRAGDTIPNTLQRIKGLNPPSPALLQPGTNAALAGAIMKLLGKPPHMRYRTCSSFMEDLRQTGLL